MLEDTKGHTDCIIKWNYELKVCEWRQTETPNFIGFPENVKTSHTTPSRNSTQAMRIKTLSYKQN